MMEEKKPPAFWAVSKHRLLQPRLVYLPGLRRSFFGFSLSAWYRVTCLDEPSHCRFSGSSRSLWDRVVCICVSNRNVQRIRKEPPNVSPLCTCWCRPQEAYQSSTSTSSNGWDILDVSVALHDGAVGCSPAKFSSPCLSTWTRQAKC